MTKSRDRSISTCLHHSPWCRAQQRTVPLWLHRSLTFCYSPCLFSPCRVSFTFHSTLSFKKGPRTLEKGLYILKRKQCFSAFAKRCFIYSKNRVGYLLRFLKVNWQTVYFILSVCGCDGASQAFPSLLLLCVFTVVEVPGRCLKSSWIHVLLFALSIYCFTMVPHLYRECNYREVLYVVQIMNHTCAFLEEQTVNMSLTYYYLITLFCQIC